MKHVLTHYRKILGDVGGGESRRVRCNFATEHTRESEVDVAERYLALVRVLVLKQSNDQRCVQSECKWISTAATRVIAHRHRNIKIPRSLRLTITRFTWTGYNTN